MMETFITFVDALQSDVKKIHIQVFLLELGTNWFKIYLIEAATGGVL